MSKVALVVGGGQTLGEFISRGLADDGYRVIVADLNEKNAISVSKEINQEYGDETAFGIGVDATNESSVKEMVERVDSLVGRIDLLVYNAGVATASKIDSFEFSDWQLSINVNLTGYFLCAREVSKIMIREGRGGRIIQINSKSGKVGSKHNSGYSAAKFGGVGLTQSLALDLAEHGVTVHSLMLGNLLKSPMFQSLIPQYAKKLNVDEADVEQIYIDKVPLKSGCDYQDVLNVLKFYASDEASYCTGQSINITGGQVMF
ncbi:sorbitol-6-phosphate 2-dehydrogenase [Salinivibrio proteolyticus]|uniref:sorbitol-6-phosphate dehydrogenase n=1 Tax=Salinivibrio TaxID=51366 RepID=UPI00098921D3|nr:MULTISPECIES: sorbitol-6-phosphate dehydrogenase [Salinivibrio]OOF22108.1 sorbitol-6-phosphate 2-dehydrogenase [Salinivibrio sp. IB574]OOF26560.1 sorbitol-6-phosphate 2-dehydrogenase [Salinivibrio proteolyticus]PCE67170.1 sorbitol-6-phosphate 2-dehydrogenase [Salinivibrio sp. YCSC6]QCF35932.1 sorbitol-6-phosphate dehydrogenase [Salinivibrio sp. YCSC6]